MSGVSPHSVHATPGTFIDPMSMTLCLVWAGGNIWFFRVGQIHLRQPPQDLLEIPWWWACVEFHPILDMHILAVLLTNEHDSVPGRCRWQHLVLQSGSNPPETATTGPP